MSEIKLSATPRTEFGKGAARRIRRADKIPAVIYGHGTEPQHITLPGHATMMAVKAANALLQIDVEGGKPILALAKDVQRDPVRNVIEHVDLVIVRRGEKVQVDVMIVTVGEAGPETVVQVEANTVPLEVEATHIPAHIEVDVEGKPAGTQIPASELVLPSGATFVGDPEMLVVNITAQVTAEALEAELSEAEAEAGIEHDAPETEAGSDSGSKTTEAAPAEDDKGDA